MIRVAILDSHPMTAFGLQKAFERTHDLIVVRTACPEEESLGSIEADVVVIGIDCDDPLPIVSELVPRARVVLMSGAAPRPFIDACLRLGAVRHLDKRMPVARFCDAVRAAAGGSDSGRSTSHGSPASHSLRQLSAREREVLAYIADGYTHEQTARRIGVSRHTVDTYVKRVRSKLAVGNKAELTRAALVPNQAP